MSATRELPGRAASPWLELPRPDRPRLEGERRADVAVVGAGIVGVLTAFELSRGGADVVLLEGGRIGQGVTGKTTAKLSSLHGLTYAGLARSHGEDAATVYAEANEAGISAIAGLIEELEIVCDFRRKDNFTYTEEEARSDDIADEVAASQAAGLATELVETSDLPFPIAAAVRLGNQAEFHPLRFLLAVAEALDAEEARVFERSRVVEVDGGTLTTDSGARVEAERVVLATHLPILDRGATFALCEPERSYALGLRLESPIPQGMYLSVDSPSRSLRSHAMNGEEMFIVGGQSARMGSDDPVEAFLELAHFARERFGVGAIEHRWSAHDYMPADGLPFIGPLWPLGEEILVATGMRKWGLAMGAAAARIMADSILGEENPWGATFDPKRIPNLGALPELAKHGALTAKHLLGDRIRRDGPAGELAPGEGAIADSGLGKRAVYRDEAGELHELSARCTHLGCVVAWNAAERTWDCPCHGSRFLATGEVAEGPATSPLERKG